MSKEQDSRLAERNIPGMMNRRERFAEPEHADDIGATVRRIVVYFVKEKKLVAGMLAVVLSGTVCGILAPSLQSGAVDIIAGEKQGILSHTLTLMLYSICGLLQGLCSARLSQNVVRRMREELFGKIVELPVRYLDTHSHGDVMSRMTNDIENISTTVSQSLPSLFSGVLTVIGTMAVMLWYCWQLALLSFVTVLLTFLETKFLSGRVRRFSRKRQQLLGQLNGTVEEIVAEYCTVVAYNHQDITVADFCATADSLTKAGIKTDIFSGVMGPVMNCIGNIGFVIVYAKQFSRPINEIAQIYGQLQTAVAGAERVFAVLDEETEDKSGAALETGEKAAVTFQNVCFSYEPGTPVIRDFTLAVPRGKKSGAGGRYRKRENYHRQPAYAVL